MFGESNESDFGQMFLLRVLKCFCRAVHIQAVLNHGIQYLFLQQCSAVPSCVPFMKPGDNDYWGMCIQLVVSFMSSETVSLVTILPSV